MSLLKDSVFFITLLPRVAWGWLRVFFRIVKIFINYFLNLHSLEKLIFIFALGQFGGTLRPWIEYSVDFLENPEILQVSIKTNLWFISLSFSILVTSQLFQLKFQKNLLLGLQILLTILVSSGFAFPNIFFTDFINPSDYHYTVFAKLFLFIHYIFLIVVIYSFFKKN